MSIKKTHPGRPDLNFTQIWKYDAKGRPITEIYRKTDVRKWHYDSRGNMIQQLEMMNDDLIVKTIIKFFTNNYPLHLHPNLHPHRLCCSPEGKHGRAS